MSRSWGASEGMTVIEAFEKQVADLGPLGEMARLTIRLGFIDSAQDMEEVRRQAAPLGDSFPLWRAAALVAYNSMLPIMESDAVLGLCTLVFSALQPTHVFFFGPDGRLWFRRRVE